jgi:hypothetical protein
VSLTLKVQPAGAKNVAPSTVVFGESAESFSTEGAAASAEGDGTAGGGALLAGGRAARTGGSVASTQEESVRAARHTRAARVRRTYSDCVKVKRIRSRSVSRSTRVHAAASALLSYRLPRPSSRNSSLHALLPSRLQNRSTALGRAAAAYVHAQCCVINWAFDDILVIVRKLRALANRLRCVDKNTLVLENRFAIGFARMVDKARVVAIDRGVNACF